MTKQETLEKLGKELEEKRERYTRSSGNERQKMANELLQLEQQYETLETEVLGMPKAIRNLEINYLKK